MNTKFSPAAASTDLTLTLQAVPKLVGSIREWWQGGRLATFKLETDESLLLKKGKKNVFLQSTVRTSSQRLSPYTARNALNQYNHSMVFANLLSLRYSQVHKVAPGGDDVLLQAPQLEKQIIKHLFE